MPTEAERHAIHARLVWCPASDRPAVCVFTAVCTACGDLASVRLRSDVDEKQLPCPACGRHTRRYSFENAIEVVDLGLRLSDIDGLLTESVYNRGSDYAVRSNLIENGATEEEVEFLLRRRVELNAMTSPQLIEFIERKLRLAGVAKIVPDRETLEEAYRRTRLLDLMRERIEGLRSEVEEEAAAEPLPADLALQIDALLVEHPEVAWDAALRKISRRP